MEPGWGQGLGLRQEGEVEVQEGQQLGEGGPGGQQLGGGRSQVQQLGGDGSGAQELSER